MSERTSLIAKYYLGQFVAPTGTEPCQNSKNQIVDNSSEEFVAGMHLYQGMGGDSLVIDDQSRPLEPSLCSQNGGAGNNGAVRLLGNPDVDRAIEAIPLLAKIETTSQLFDEGLAQVLDGSADIKTKQTVMRLAWGRWMDKFARAIEGAPNVFATMDFEDFRTATAILVLTKNNPSSIRDNVIFNLQDQADHSWTNRHRLFAHALLIYADPAHVNTDSFQKFSKSSLGKNFNYELDDILAYLQAPNENALFPRDFYATVLSAISKQKL